MLDKQTLEAYTGEFNLYQVEKDYLQHIVLRRLYQEFSNELVFKGGTALQKVYNTGRFSEDLDFTSGVPSKDERILFHRVEGVFNRLNDFYATKFSKITNKTSTTYKLKIEGPLYVSKSQSMQSILVEISMRDNVLLHPDAVPIAPIYIDIGNYIATVMNINEILAEKIRAIMTRRRARDLYDIYFILSKGVKIDVDIVNKKLSYYELIYNKDVFLKRAAALKIIWDDELKQLMKRVPEFDFLYKHVADTVTKKQPKSSR